MNVTTIEQSKHLLELGLKPESADLFYSIYRDPICGFSGYEVLDFVSNWKTAWGDRPTTDIFDENNIPAWSLAALEKVMPSFQSNKYVGKYNYEFIKDEWSNGPDYKTDNYDNPIDSAYEMICWLLENKYIKP